MSIYLLMFVSLDIIVWAPETFFCTFISYSSESLTEAPDLVAGLWRPLYVEWRNYAINYVKRPIWQKRTPLGMLWSVMWLSTHINGHYGIRSKARADFFGRIYYMSYHTYIVLFYIVI
jgi:hypothetical protein